MDYITLNNKKSTNITGLIIQELPPIIKPMIRTNVEEIDGRDGDIITKLGYSAYDKTVRIGLTRNYDIDEVIAYFNSEGIVTFSNEPDKYYKYTIIEQIDFNKLLRFKEADVTFHVQPFKYSTLEGEITTTSPLSIYNKGNIYSKPTLKVTGTGNVNIYLNGIQAFLIRMGSTSNTITIDCSQMEAYDNSSLRNRDITGEYDKFKLNVGSNEITFDGNITELSVNHYSRWL